MKLATLVVCLSTFALASANAATYRITLNQETEVAGTMLKPGDYKIEVSGDKAMIRSGKQQVEAHVKTETNDRKYSDTTISYSDDHGKYSLQEVHVGHSKTKLVF